MPGEVVAALPPRSNKNIHRRCSRVQDDVRKVGLAVRAAAVLLYLGGCVDIADILRVRRI